MKIMALDMNDFISDCIFKTPSMIIMLYDEKNQLIKSFVAPPGLQFDRYIRALYPTKGFYVPAGGARDGILKIYITG
jgi:hypothetical protein